MTILSVFKALVLDRIKHILRYVKILLQKNTHFRGYLGSLTKSCVLKV